MQSEGFCKEQRRPFALTILSGGIHIMRTRNLTLFSLLALSAGTLLQAQAECGLHSVRGVWSSSAIGWAIPLQAPTAGPLPIVMLGVTTIDYAGKMTGGGTAVWGGEVLDYEFADATVTVNADCTGVMKYAVKLKGTPAPVPGQYVERLVVVPDKHEAVTVPTKSPLSKPMWVNTMKRISPAPYPVTW